jgi:predicted Zn-dependent protease
VTTRAEREADVSGHRETVADLRALVGEVAALAGGQGEWSVRLEATREECLTVRQGLLEPPRLRTRRGAFLAVSQGGGVGYGATADLTRPGLAAALARARHWARASAALGLAPRVTLVTSAALGRYATPDPSPWDALPLAARLDLVRDACRRLKRHERIVDWQAGVSVRRTERLVASSAGGLSEQRLEVIVPDLVAVANRGTETQRRSHGGWDGVRQGGLEQLAAQGFPDAAERVADEALALLDAPECPEGRLDLVLMPSQMALQIHESIGHPLELDRILGDERNFAGSSFVTPDMFGHYRYGSALLNVTFDPTVPGEVVSCGWDDEGTPATREHLIRAGVLERPLGGALSQARSGLPGVACARASGWNRPAIDRMGNLNLEPGDQDLAALIGQVEDGVLMDTNRSWSIDDTRNKFQFGCEYGRRIRAGRLAEVVRNPGYRGTSARFWRSLAAVGDHSTFRVHGVTSCGKGEPNQLLAVGHAAPACLFRQVECFGGG